MNNTSNPSDYEFLMKSLIEGNHIAKAQSLKRFNVLVLSDKKQFSSYAKRIVIAIQDLMTEPKEDINLLAGTLVLEIINLNPRDIEFYVKSKLLKYLVINLGDSKPQIRKTSHYCLLGYIRTFKIFDDLIEAYLNHGILSNEWQLRQKSINSFQSILVMEIRYLNWYSNQFRRIFQMLLNKLKDQNGFVQKASEQCLLSLSKVQQLRNFSRKLSPTMFMQLKNFCEHQVQVGNLHDIKLDIHQKKNQTQKILSPTVSILSLQKMDKSQNQESHRKKIPTPKLQEKIQNERTLRKAESVMTSNHKQLQQSLNLKQARNQQRLDRSLKRESSLLFPLISNVNPNPTKQQKLQIIVGKKLIQDLKNDKDWKVRLEAIEQLQTKFQISKEQFEIEVLMKNLLPILIRLLGDANFKIALIALKIIQHIIKIPAVNLQAIGPQIVQKLNDNKVALRQNISKLIKKEYMSSKDPLWLDYLLMQVKKTANSNVKQQILNILSKVYEDGNIPYSFQKILQSIHPLMDDLKTKIKIKTLDLLATITIKSQKLDRAKNLLATKLNQVYYEMYLQKIGKELKTHRQINQSIIMEKQPTSQRQKPMRTSMNQLSKRISKIGNTTSTSLQRLATAAKLKDEQNSTVKTAFYEAKLQTTEKIQNNISRLNTDNDDARVNETSQMDNITVNTDEQGSPKKKNQNKFLRRRNNKSVQSRLLTTNYSNDDAFPPFNDATKELKNIMIQIKSDDWQISNQALNKCRRLILNHSQLLVSSTLRLLVPDIMKLAESLRSTVSKNGLVVMYELSSKVQKQLDPQFDMIFSKLIKKSLDANSFISQQVKKSLITICSNCNEFKVVNALNTTHISRAIPIKTAIVNIIEGVAFLPKFYQKELDKIVMILADFMNQGSLQIRQKTKAILNNIIMSEKGQSIMKFIPSEQRNKLKKRQSILGQSKVHNQSSQIILQEKKSIIHHEPQSQQPISKKKKKHKILDFPAEFQMFDGYLQNCQSSDWKTRLQNMTLISKVCFQYPDETVQHKSNSKIVDVLSKQINDPNIKVAINALKIFQEITEKIPSLVEGSLSVILNEIFMCFSSNKVEIKSLSEVLFDSICHNIQNWMLTQHLCNGALYSVQKSKPVIILKLNKLIPSIYKVKPNIFQKNVYPMINKLAEQNKPEINISLRQLLQTLYSQVGEECMTYLKQKAKSLIVQ